MDVDFNFLFLIQQIDFAVLRMVINYTRGAGHRAYDDIRVHIPFAL